MPRLLPANRVLAQTIPVPGYHHYLTPLRKLIFDYDPLSPSQHGIRSASLSSFASTESSLTRW